MFPNIMVMNVALVLGTVAVFFYAFTSGNKTLLFGAVLFAPVVFLINRPDILMTIIIALFTSYITLPQLPMNMNAFYLLAFFFSVLMLANKIITKTKRPFLMPHLMALCFAAVLLVTAYFRGFGLRAFGSSTWGGAPYILLLIATAFLLASREIDLSPKQWRWALYALCLLSVLAPLSQALYALSGGRLYQQFYFIVPDMGAVSYLRGLRADTEFARLQIANITSQFYFILALLLLRPRTPGRILVILVLLAISLILVGISGHRIAIVFNLILTLLYIGLDIRKPLLRRLVNRVTMGCLLAVLALGLVADKLPLTYQRALAWIPGAHVSYLAKVDAYNTARWRLDVWRAMWDQIPEYWLVGKGFAFSSSDISIIANTPMSSVDFVIASHNYHNGLLGTLLDLGVLGLLFALAFAASAVRLALRRLRYEWHHPQLRHYHRVVCGCFIAQFLVYFIAAGGPTTYATLYFWFVVMEGLHRTDVRLAARATAIAESKPVVAGLTPRASVFTSRPIRA